jgi:anthranilate synthase/aminodeoxychorismate synthase-like glutamine amidotransferase
MGAHVLVIDNYDSFTFNLVQALAVLGAEVEVHANDRVEVAEVIARRPTHVVVSPGPGRPEEAGVSLALMRAAVEGALDAPVLGVCLGHQCLGLASGGRVVPAQRLVHGRASEVVHDGSALYRGIPRTFAAGRYHSLAIAKAGLPAALTVTAEASDGEIMGVRHASGRAEGVQFHPESVLTKDGVRLLDNFLRLDASAPGGAR